MTNCVIFVQARLGSQRFPRKVLASFCDAPMLVYQIRRLMQAGLPVHVMVPHEDLVPIESTLARYGLYHVWGVTGDPADVLGRFARPAALLPPGTVIVRACGDCPMLCPSLLRVLLAQWDATPGLAYLGMGPGWPDGLADYDLFTREAVLEADDAAITASDREHVAPFFWKNPAWFRQTTYPAPDWVRAHQWPKVSVDTPEDLAYVEQVAQAVTAQHGAGDTYSDVLHTIEATPALQRHYEPMNAAYMASVAEEQGRATMAWEDARYR